jgi:ABC-type lipoprotein release transport system permease subunit
MRTLRKRYGRTTLITTGIALAIAFSTIMLSIGEAIQYSSQEIIEDTGVDILAEPPVDLPPLFLEFTSIFEISNGREIADAMVNDNPKIREASPWLMENLYISKKTEKLNYLDPPKFSLFDCRGYIPERNRYFSAYKIIEGTALPTIDDPFYTNGNYHGGLESENFTHEILISESLSKIINATVGDIVYINPIIITDEFTNESLEDWFNNATWFKIFGIKEGLFESQNALTGHIHLSELQYLTGKSSKDKINKIYISLNNKADQDEVITWLKNECVYKDKISAHRPEAIIEDISELTRLLEGFSKMVVIITILVVVLFISTVLMISTRERSMEIGALRAIGISKLTISKFIFKESLIICLIGLILGLILGYFASNIINDYIIDIQPYLPTNFRVTRITPYIIAQVTAITIIIAILAGLGPSYWAMRLKPVETLRNE